MMMLAPAFQSAPFTRLADGQEEGLAKRNLSTATREQGYVLDSGGGGGGGGGAVLNGHFQLQSAVNTQSQSRLEAPFLLQSQTQFPLQSQTQFPLQYQDVSVMPPSSVHTHLFPASDLPANRPENITNSSIPITHHREGHDDEEEEEGGEGEGDGSKRRRVPATNFTHQSPRTLELYQHQQQR